MEEKLKQLLLLLAENTSGFLSSNEIASALHVSSRTVFRYMRALEDANDRDVFSIATQKSGYRLTIENKAAFAVP